MRAKLIGTPSPLLSVTTISRARHRLFEVRGPQSAQQAAQRVLTSRGATSRMIDIDNQSVLVVPTNSECNKDIDVPAALDQVASVTYKK